jgi:phenylpropionate dioxygenase-like ring-hydroxylating dioxygenase large terminal subunit
MSANARHPAPLHPDVAVVLDGLDASDGPVESARVLPPEAYMSAAFYEFEMAAVYMRSWLCVGRAQQIPAPGDYMALTLADEPVLVVRGNDGEIRVLSAVCRHRGHTLKEECTGNTRTFTCPYHRWTYDLAGEFVGAPHMGQTASLAELKRTEALPQLKVELWYGFIFVNFDSAAKALAPTMTKLEPYMAGYDLDNMVTVEPEVTTKPLPWNWKMLLENYIEPYHTQFVHPIIHDFAPSTGVEFDASCGPDDNVIVRYVPFLERDGSLTENGWAAPSLFPIIEGLSEKQRNRVGFGMVPPNMNIIFMPDMLCYGLVFPQGPTSLKVGGGLFTAGGWCMPKSTVALPDFHARANRMMEGSRQLGEQDTTVNLAMQRSKYSRFAPRGRFSYLEETLAQFNRWLAVRYRAEARRRNYPTPSAAQAAE